MKWLALLLVLLMCGAASAATSDFGYYKTIDINQTMVNQSIGIGQYPLLVSITDANLSARCQADGDDIVFYDADNTTQLDHEIEFWNSTTGVLVAWVNVTDVINVTHIMMYYYDTDGVNLEDAAGVWDVNFTMIQHLQETDVDGGIGDIKDSTSNNNNGTTNNMDSSDQIEGVIGGSFIFDGNTEFINVSDVMDFRADTGVFTVTCWINSSADPVNNYFIGNSAMTGFYHGVWGTFNTTIAKIDDGTDDEYIYDSTNVISDSNWHYVGITLDSGTNEFLCWVDGSHSGTGVTGSVDDLDDFVLIGAGWQSAGYYFTGSIDEVRTSDIIRTHAYFETDYNNSVYHSLFIGIGSEQSNGGDITAPSVTSLSDSPDPQGFGENVTISCNVTDVVGVDTVLVGITPPGEIETNYTMAGSGDTYSYTFSDWINGSYNYTIYANDSANNINNTESGTFELYSETYIHIKTLKDTYGSNKYVNITDPASISSVSGIITSGSNVTISGSDFETKSPVAPIKHDFFNQGSYQVGDTISNGWDYSSQSTSYNEPKYNNSAGRANSVMHMRCNFSDGHYGSAFAHIHDSALSPVYTTFYFRSMHHDGIATDNEKFFRIARNDSSYVGNGPSVTNAMIGVGGNLSSVIRNEDGSNIDNDPITASCAQPTNETWNRIEAYYVESNPFETKNGIQRVWIQYGGVGNTFTKTIDRNIYTNKLGGTIHWGKAIFGKYVRLGQTGVPDVNTSYSHDFDDVYIDTTLSRVEIGDNASWNGCTHREIQLPTAWSDTSAIVTINQGSFGDSDTVYLFIVNSSGDASDGYLITFGSGSAPVRSAGAPSGAQTAGTTSLNISLTTDINASCRFMNDTGGVDFVNMTNNFTTTGNLSHETTVTGLSDGNEYTYCVRCNSSEGVINTDDYNITFSISNVNNTMTTWDTSDGELKNASETIYFYVNYTNTTGPINSSGDYVNISFADTIAGPFAGNLSMVYNATTEWYEYNRSWATVGQYFYEVKAYENSVLDNEEINYIDVDYQSRIYNKQTTNNITANVLMQVEFYNTTTSSWVLDDVCYNSSHQITPETNLKLDDLFNGTWHTTDNASFGDGTYRVYVAYTDPSGNVLENLDGTYMNDSYNFTLDTSVNTVTLYANEYAAINNWTADQTFQQIAANISNDVAYSYYNSTSGLWEAYRAGYTYNANAIVPKNCSAFVFVNSQTTVSATPNTGGVTITQDAWFYGYLPGSTAKTLTEIETAMDTDGLDVWSLYGWDNATQVYTTTGSYSVSPNEGYAAYVNTTGEYTP